MSKKGTCDKCGASSKVYYCPSCEKNFCKKCVQKTMMKIPKCPLCEQHLQK